MTIADGEQPRDFNFTGGSLPLEPIPHPRDVPTDADRYADDENRSPDDHPAGVNALVTSDMRPARLGPFFSRTERRPMPGGRPLQPELGERSRVIVGRHLGIPQQRPL